MARHVVIGTAGHVDHGKTSLVKALTGVDTDRWEEEKKRGITIDIGFAQMSIGDDVDASIVDVPGHEDFVRNMVAGATGIDIALLVIAGDEGVMPQTTEHLAILQFLGISSGVVAITKADLVEAEWLELVIDDVAELLGNTSIKWQKPVAVSANTGQGIEELRESLASLARAAQTRPTEDLFRMPVDRSFSVAGAGTVVTGTAWAGTVASGDTVRILPKGIEARVRSVEVHGHTEGSALPGRRTALALVGVARNEGARGSVVVADSSWKKTTRLDVRVTLLPNAKPLTQRSRVRIHLGTAEVMARVTPSGGDIVPGEPSVARLRLESPLVGRFGDRGVIRSYSPVTTIGGFQVIDPWPPRRPGRPSGDPRRWSDDPLHRVAAAVELGALGSVTLADLPVRIGIRPSQIDEIVGAIKARHLVSIQGFLYQTSTVHTHRDRGSAALEAFHRDHPLEPGMPLEALRLAAGEGLLADHILDELKGEGRVAIEHGTVRLKEFIPTLRGSHAELGVVVERRLAEAGTVGLTPSELADEMKEAAGGELLSYLSRNGKAVKVGPERYYEPKILNHLVELAVTAIRSGGSLTPAELRSELGLSRKYLIPFLEWLDDKGVTVRSADGRSLGPEADRGP